MSLIDEISKLSIPALPQPLELVGDWLVTGDVHIPFTDWTWILKLIAVGRKHKIKNLLVAGDWWNYDHLSVFKKLIPGPTWQTERAAGKAAIKALGEWFACIEMLTGNHDRRRSMASNGEEDDEDIFSPLAASCKNLHSTLYSYCKLHSGGELYTVVHPNQYRQAPLSLVNDLAQKCQTHVIGFHEHHFGITMDKYNRYIVINGGTLVDWEKMAWTKLDINARPTMKRGFVMVRDGCPTLYGAAPFTDWGKYGSATGPK